VSELDIAVISLLGFGETNMDTASMAMLETMAGKTVCLLAEESALGGLNCRLCSFYRRINQPIWV